MVGEEEVANWGKAGLYLHKESFSVTLCDMVDAACSAAPEFETRSSDAGIIVGLCYSMNMTG